MKHTRKVSLLLCVLCVAAILLCFSACKSEADMENNTILAEQFMDHVIADDYDAAYGMVKATVTDPDFREYWISIQAAAEGATACELEQVSGQLSKAGGEVDRTAGYKVYLDNGHTVYLRVMTREGIEGIAGIHFSDVTEFLRDTESTLPTVQIILWVVSGLFIAFTVWMFVDCLRRKLKYKVVWALVILFGAIFTVTVGEAPNVAFNLALFFQPSTIRADMGLVSVVTEAVIPLGALLYLCLRKRFQVDPSESNGGKDTVA
ncbi:MAG: hypothetical protein IKU90_03610 [Clostridia bacterium]|nr:hypothetical protein [Clostridia bacterium]